MIITIDGGAGTGKTTVAQRVAARLGFLYFDTGALYRSFAWWSSKQDVDSNDLPGLLNLFATFEWSIDASGQERHYRVSGVDITDEIRSRKITELSSHIAAFPQIREALLKTQRDFGASGNVVFEGRDLGTVVFPMAEIKIFLTADPVIRAQRRLAEMQRRHLSEPAQLSEELVLEEMKKRDLADTMREVAPLRPPEGAHFIDTTHLTIDAVVDAIVAYVQEKR